MCGCLKEQGVEVAKTPTVGKIYAIGDESIGFGRLVNPVTNESAASATVVITTDAVDRQRESILATGIDIDFYRQNPVVLWEHGLDPSLPLPVGTSAAPSGELSLRQFPTGWEATCYFAQSLPDAMQIFALVNDRVIRAASIQAIPDPASVSREFDEDGRPYRQIKRCSMVEWSWGRIGVNQEAVRKTLSAGKVGGERLLPSFRHWLQAVCPARKTWRSPGVPARRPRVAVLGADRYRLSIKSPHA